MIDRSGVGPPRTCVERRPAGLGLITIGAHRIVYGVVTVATILVYRNYFHPITEVEPPSPISGCWSCSPAPASSSPRS